MNNTVPINCPYLCPCGSNDRGGSNLSEGVCSRAYEYNELRQYTSKLIEVILDPDFEWWTWTTHVTMTEKLKALAEKAKEEIEKESSREQGEQK